MSYIEPVYDVIVVGARCAGAPLAMLVARAGHRVLLVDRGSFPSDRTSTHYVKRAGAALLRDWGLLDELDRIGTPCIRSHILYAGGFRLEGRAPAHGDVDADYTPRRVLLDQILVDAAREAGVEVREDFSATGLAHEAGRVVGIRGRAKGGSSVELRARVVVGADGVDSFVARNAGAPAVFDAGSFTCAYYAYFSGIRDRDDAIEVHHVEQQRRVLITFPTNDDLDVVLVFWPVQEARAVRADREGAFHSAVGLAPELAERVRRGRRVGEFRGKPALPNFIRQSHGPGWALIGDAAVHRDPLTAQGISSAFLHADLLAGELSPALAGASDVDAALARYTRKQVERSKPMLDLTVMAAQLGPLSPHVREVLGRLAEDPQAFDALLGAIVGSRELEDVLGAEAIQDVARAVDELALPALAQGAAG